MNIKLIVKSDVQPSELAKSLADATPKDFARFWFAFYEETKDKDLMPFAKEMSEYRGSNRQKPLVELCELMQFCKTQERLKDDKT